MQQNQIDIQAKTVDEAIYRGLQTLQCSIDDVVVEILQEANRGLFGIGARDCVVRLTRRLPVAESQMEEAQGETQVEEVQGEAQAFLSQVLKLMGIQATLHSKEDDDYLRINISANVTGVLIGRRGETLDALQYLTSIVYNHKAFRKRVVLDTENYRHKREETLVRLASRLSNKVRTSGEPVSLEPMTPYERRILHSALQNNPYVTTRSQGEEPNRYIVLLPREGEESTF